MLKIATALAVPGVVGGASLLYDPSAQAGLMPPLESYVVQLGLAFDPDAVRAALPQGLDPVPGSTGGIAVYYIQEDPALPARSAGYIWIDLDYGVPARFLLRTFDGPAEEPAPPLEPVAFAATAPDAPLYEAAGQSGREAIQLAVRPAAGTCSDGIAAQGQILFGTTAEGRLEVLHNPFMTGWCGADVVSASVTAPPEEVLGSFAPERILWAGVAKPFGGTLPGFISD